ncbi:MAG: nucleotidyltransferase domain-containing protein [Planctomycetes bacterium]|nr:nucleotidyltransferase domain-containing protein [Planctomycetota bacterium]
MTFVADNLQAAIARGPRAHFVALFGSAAKGGMRADSDVDIAWLPEDAHLPLSAELDFQAALTLAAGREVDPVRVDHASTLCRSEVARFGIQLAGQRASFVRFRAEAMAEFLDFEPALRDATERYRRAVLARQHGDKPSA